MSTKHQKADRWEWIYKWLKKNHTADCLSQKFHEEYHEQFPEYKIRETMWGAQTVGQAMKDLREMQKKGLLFSGRVGLGTAWTPGLPKYVLGYSLTDLYLKHGDDLFEINSFD